MKSNWRFGFGLTAICGIALLAAGCSSGVSGNRYLSKDETIGEYRAEARNWELAPGWNWPAEPYSGEGPDGKPAVYEQGSAKNDVSFYWFCSWGSTWLEAELSSVRAAAASRLADVPNSPFYKTLLERDRRFFDEEVLDPIARGDTTRPRAVIITNCQKRA